MQSTAAILLILLALGSVWPASAHDLGAARPAKPAVTIDPPPPDPAVLRQGGDTILDAVLIPIGVFNLTGTTAGYNDDYDEVCPYTTSTSPDVVYTILPAFDMTLIYDMYGSSYDTKIYAYDENLTLIGCNDDFYPDYTSQLEITVAGGVQYFLVIDGYGGAFGDYVLSNVCIPPILECPPGGIAEGEPPLADGYVDAWNGGCNTDAGNPPLQPLTEPVLCGVSGWYSFEGANMRDTDWYTVRIPEAGILEIVGDAERPSYMFELGPQDCGSVGVLQDVTIGPFSEGTLTVTGAAGSTVWLWVGPQTFTPLGSLREWEYDYVLITNLVTVATVERTWSSVKTLFR